MDIGWVMPWDRLTVLDLARQRLGDEGVREIVRRPECAGLRWLGLSENGLTREGLRLLAEAKHLNLNYLDVRSNLFAKSDAWRLEQRYPDAVVLA
jgi:Ran GTPase-activating protein (RanGAP) involved in mRNA processing and transport